MPHSVRTRARSSQHPASRARSARTEGVDVDHALSRDALAAGGGAHERRDALVEPHRRREGAAHAGDGAGDSPCRDLELSDDVRLVVAVGQARIDGEGIGRRADQIHNYPRGSRQWRGRRRAATQRVRHSRAVGTLVGLPVGTSEGTAVVGAVVGGRVVAWFSCLTVGRAVGADDGRDVGTLDGADDGTAVGAMVGSPSATAAHKAPSNGRSGVRAFG